MATFDNRNCNGFACFEIDGQPIEPTVRATRRAAPSVGRRRAAGGPPASQPPAGH
jgi:hypothetical protein